MAAPDVPCAWHGFVLRFLASPHPNEKSDTRSQLIHILMASTKPSSAAGSSTATTHSPPTAHLLGSATAAVVNFPLWKAAAIGQSGFKEAADFTSRMRLVFGPPYKGVAATIFGMTWARAGIFYGSDVGKERLLEAGFSKPVASTLPPIGISALVQVANQPIVRSTIMLQDPSSTQPNVLSQLVQLWRMRGWKVRQTTNGCAVPCIPCRRVGIGAARALLADALAACCPRPVLLWQALYHGSSASVLKTVPKYVCAIWVKDWVAAQLPPPTPPDGTPGGARAHRQQVLNAAALKSVAAGVAGAALTNPLDVIRNEMFKFEEGFMQTVTRLLRTEGTAFCYRGMQRNLIAVAVPIGMTIFITEAITEVIAKR